MASPSCKCVNQWRGSFFVYDQTLQFEDDGTLNITNCNPQTGEITGSHYNPQYDGPVTGVCQQSGPHIRLERETIINGVTYVVSYHGNIRDTTVGPIIVEGRFKKRVKGGPKIAGDDGDWTAQGTTTLVAESWQRKARDGK